MADRAPFKLHKNNCNAMGQYVCLTLSNQVSRYSKYKMLHFKKTKENKWRNLSVPQKHFYFFLLCTYNTHTTVKSFNVFNV